MAMSLEECLVNLSCADDWHGIIEAGNHFSVEEKSKFLWAWPKNAQCFQWLKIILVENHIGSILSIGCGSGLLEWLIKKTTGINVIGLEFDKSWWTSKYSPKTFVDLKFIEHQITNKFLQKCIETDENQFALLFCYFNNREAFLEYVRAYDGNLIILVGPSTVQHIVTDPNPMHPKFENDDWCLFDYFQFNDQLENCMSVFIRKKH